MKKTEKKKGAETADIMENLVTLLKRRGFIYQGSEIYGGLAGTWDYAPLGVALKNNVKNLWWKRFVTDREDMYGMDAAILMNQNVWKASGHVSGFSDPLVECLICNKRSRVDNIVDNSKYEEVGSSITKLVLEAVKDGKLQATKDDVDHIVNLTKKETIPEEDLIKLRKEIHSSIELKASKHIFEMVEGYGRYTGTLTKFFLDNFVDCPSCKKRKWGEPRQFNMMFKTNIGASEDAASVSYLRPETAQGMFVNFKNIIDSFHPILPFGMAQIGKAFRNEIAPRDFTFRTREFEQMEIEYFVNPNAWEETFNHFVKEVWAFTNDVGLSKEKVHENEIAKDSLAHYSKRTIDFEFDFPFGQKELYGLAYRTDFDLKAHSNASGTDLSYYDEEAKIRFTPHCIEPSFGVDRTILAVLTDAYREDELGGEKRVYLKLSPNVAPIKVAVFPLLKNKDALTSKAQELYKVLRKELGAVEYDVTGSIGKRYRRQDEIGTPYCVTVDFETIEKDNSVTVRDRDTGGQERVKIDDLISFLGQKLGK